MSNPRLPKGSGHSWDEATFWGYGPPTPDEAYGTNENGDPAYSGTTDLRNRCECGVNTTYGTGPETEYLHTDICPLHKKKG